MEILFKFVSSAGVYADEYGYHAHFFEESGGFAIALAIAGGAALICALVFYFGLCTSLKTIRSASLPVWIVFLILSAGVSFVAADQVLIGSEPEDDSEVVSSNFYADMEDYYLEMADEAPTSEQEKMNKAKNEIIEQLNQGDDVAMMLGLNTAIWSGVFFYILSILLKGFSVNGVAIPHLWPHGRK